MLITDSPNWSTYSIEQLIKILEAKDNLLMERKRIKLSISGLLEVNQFSNLRDRFNNLVGEGISKETVIDEILRQRELRILKHRREWHCDPHNMSIVEDDIIQARKYLNTVEDWGDEYHEERITREDD